MKFRSCIAGVALAVLLGTAPAFSQAGSEIPPIAPARPAETAANPSTPAVDCNCIVIPALTSIELVLDAQLDSKISKGGEKFPLRLAKPIIIDGQERLPAGFIGEGEVVHAKKSGGMGTSGELILAARFLAIGDRQLKLRSMRVGVGTDGKTDSVNSATAMGAIVSPVFGYLMSGKNIVIPNGTVAIAKTSEAFSIPLTAPAGQPKPAEFTSEPVVQTTTIQDRK